MVLTSTHHLELGEREVRKTYADVETGGAEREWQVLCLLAERAPGLAPAPLRREVSQQGRETLVMSRLPGRHLAGLGWDAARLDAAAGAWRRLWSVPVEGVELPPRRLGPGEFSGRLRQWATEEAELDDCQDVALVAEALAAARSWLADPPVPDGPAAPVVGAADGNAANVLWDGETCRLVDFEDAGLSDLAYELADITEHVSVRVEGGVAAMDLVRAVGVDAVQQDRWAAYRPVFACFWLVMLLPGRGAHRRNPPGTTENQARHLLSLLG